MRSFTTAFAALLLASSAAFPALAETPAAISSQAEKPTWAFEESDLPVDSDFRFGQLDNGLRYVIRHNASPAGTGQVRLLVGVGSISETDSEQGYAHFIEHMAFNGSTHVPEAEMVKLLEREGLAFGPDTNAYTSQDHTLYMLDLPRNDPALLDTALMLMRETGSELTFDQGAIDREKGVVLSEKRVRDTFSFRNEVDRLGFFYPGSRVAARLPIGTVETLQAATSANMRALYARSYTPENSAVVVVGDFDVDAVEAGIRKHFASWSSPHAAEVPSAGPIDFARAGQTQVFLDPALTERVTAARTGPYVDEKDSIATRRKNLLRQVGYGIVNRRLARLGNGENPPFQGAGFGTGDLFETARTTNLVVIAPDGGWKAGLTAAIGEYRTALEYGFTAGEVAEQLANIRTSLENQVATAATRYNATFTDAAVALLRDDLVPTTPQSGLERFNEFEPSITPEAVLASLKEEAVPLDNPLLRFEGRTAPVGGAEALRAAWNDAMAAPTVRPAEQNVGTFSYTGFGTPGTVVDDRVDPRMGIREIRFANGVRLNLKKTDLRLDKINFQLSLDGGDMLNTREDPLATGMVSSLLLGGLGKHSFDDLQTILAGKSVSAGIDSTERTFQMDGITTPRDLELQLDLLAASLTDPGYRTQAEERYRRGVADYFARLNATPSSALNNALPGIISDGDPRFATLPEADYMALTFAKTREDISDRLARGAIELALVGDFDEAQAIALVGKTLGALPAREPDFQAYTANRTRSFTVDRSARTVTHDGAPNQTLLSMTWPTRDDADPLEALKLDLLDRLLQVELTDVLREKLGQTYSPSVSANESRTYTGYGTFSISAAIDTADVAATRQAIVETITDLRAKPVDDDTLLRARRPLLESFENALKTNGGWMGLVDRAQTESDRIDRFLATKQRLENITPKDLQEIAQRYLDPAQRLEIVVSPKAAK